MTETVAKKAVSFRVSADDERILDDIRRVLAEEDGIDYTNSMIIRRALRCYYREHIRTADTKCDQTWGGLSDRTFVLKTGVASDIGSETTSGLPASFKTVFIADGKTDR